MSVITIPPSLRVPFGQKDGHMVSPADVESGRACGCICPGCGLGLIAKKGELNIWHFAHDGLACSTGAETAVHLMAKQLLAEERNIQLPPVIVTLTATDAFGKLRTVSATLAKGRHVQYTKVDLEVTMDNRRPDAVGTCLYEVGGEHRIEVFVHHQVDAVKAAELEALNCACYEIRLNDLSGQISIEQLRAAVTRSPDRVRWISHPGIPALRKKLAENLRKMLEFAESWKKAEDERAQLQRSASFRENRADNMSWARRKRSEAQQADRIKQANETYRLAGDLEKRSFLASKLRYPTGQVPAVVDQQVKCEELFSVPRDVWQADVFRKVIFSAGRKIFTVVDVMEWLSARYVVVGPHGGAQSALIQYLGYLLRVGVLGKADKSGGDYRVQRDVAPWLESSVLTEGSWFWAPPAGSCSLRDLQDANDQGNFGLSSDVLLMILRRVNHEHRTDGQPDDAARSLAQRLQISPNVILRLLSAALVVSLPQAVQPAPPPRWQSQRKDDFPWPGTN